MNALESLRSKSAAAPGRGRDRHAARRSRARDRRRRARPRAAAGRAGSRQDAAEQDAAGALRRRVQARAGHVGSHAGRHHRRARLRHGARDFVFRPGPVFADVLLVDEINRAGPKTQSALLEAMEERQVTVDRKNYPLPDELPGHRDAEPARVRGHLSVARVAARPVHAAHRSRISGARARAADPRAVRQHGRARGSARAGSPRALRSRAAQAAVEQVHVAPELCGYVVDLAAASRDAHACESRAVDARRARIVARRAHRRRHARRASSSRPTT